MKKITQFLLPAVVMLFTTVAFSQSTITGTIVDSDMNAPLPGANVVEKGTSNGTTSDFDGNFTLKTDASSGEVVISFVGYASQTLAFSGDQNLGTITLTPDNTLDEVVVTSGIIDIAKERETPVAVSTISAKEISLKVGNQEFPEIMNNTPGVYSTKQGGGYGDSRISLRGFDQRNTSFLINGQPVNDMENGWVYWSNWQGLTDVASGIQIQRGLGASRLAVPSVGGTVSIFTKSAEKQRGGAVTQMIGNDNYFKTTVAYNTGVNEKGWSSSYLLSRWSGDGYVYNTKGEGYTYFFAVGYTPENSNHAFNFSFLGAGQWHNQRDAWVSIRDYEYFGDNGIDVKWNSNGGRLNGEEYSMRRNFYNKPLATFNWDWDISENVKLATSLYGSAGRGGGTGPRGKNYYNATTDILPYNKDLYEHYIEDGRGARLSNGFIDFNAIVDYNVANATPYTGSFSAFDGQLIASNGFSDDGVNNASLVRRASMNSHDWYGAISSLDITSGKFRYSIGVDLRSYKGYHYRSLVDLLGYDAYYSTGNQNSAGQIITTTIQPNPFRNTGLKDPKIDYYNIGIVGWTGFNGLVEYNDEGKFTAVLQGGWSNQSFQRKDLFDQPLNPKSDKKNVGGGYVKGGANYNINDQHNVFFNAGYISRQPNFDAVFPNFANDVNPDLQNEEITSFELGYGFKGEKLSLNVNLYSTNWGNRFVSRGFTNNQVDYTAQFKDINERHQGIEVEATYRPMSNLKLRGMLSIGDWKYTKNFGASVYDDNNQPVGVPFELELKDVKIGDAAQTTAVLSADYRIIDDLSVDVNYRYVDNLYADYGINDSIFSDGDTTNNEALQLPSFGLVDFGSTYSFDLFKNRASVRLNINNVFDTTYIAESNSNITASSPDALGETWKGIDKANYVWFGFGTTWNFTFRYQF